MPPVSSSFAAHPSSPQKMKNRSSLLLASLALACGAFLSSPLRADGLHVDLSVFDNPTNAPSATPGAPGAASNAEGGIPAEMPDGSKNYPLNIVAPNSTYAAPAGFVNLPVAAFHTVEKETWKFGPGYVLTFDSVDNYDLAQAANPLVCGGIFVAQGKDSAFSISGLKAGDKVTVYAICGWNGPDRGACLSLGPTGRMLATEGSNYSDTAPGTKPVLKDFVKIGTVTADDSGTVTGKMSSVDAAEGQLGGLVINVLSN